MAEKYSFGGVDSEKWWTFNKEDLQLKHQGWDDWVFTREGW